MRALERGDFLATTLPTLFPVAEGSAGLRKALDELCRKASQAVADKYTALILSDREMDRERAPIPSLLALAAVNNHLVREGTRMPCALVVESGEPREVHHFALLIGYGASAVNPYLALETLGSLVGEGRLAPEIHAGTGGLQLHESSQQGAAENLLEDGDLDAPELSRARRYSRPSG